MCVWMKRNAHWRNENVSSSGSDGIESVSNGRTSGIPIPCCPAGTLDASSANVRYSGSEMRAEKKQQYYITN